jgi:hypothetical protein
LLFPVDLRIANAIGGLNKYDQLKELKAGAEVSGRPRGLSAFAVNA